MSDRPPRAGARRPPRFLTVLVALALAAPACAPAPGSTGGPATSKVPEVANRQKHMDEMLKKSEAKSTANPR